MKKTLHSFFGVQQDPAVKAGVFRLDLHPWTSGKGVLAHGVPMP